MIKTFAAGWQYAGLLITLIILQACSESPQLGLVHAPQSENVSFVKDVKPILDRSCVSCHACYDAPCQLKLSSHDGIERGGSKDKVYNPTRLKEAPLSRLYFDAESVAEWREKGFHTVLSQPDKSVDEASTKQFSILTGMLELKAKNPHPMNFKEIDVPLADPKEWQCPSDQSEFNEFANDYPQRGMPYALPALTQAESQTIANWLASGASDDRNIRISVDEEQWVTQWESFLNQDSLKAQLVARYIYEHLFLASLHSPETKSGRYFQLVRSKTPPGQALDLIATRRPYDDPGVERVYYRLRLKLETVVAKTHMPYLLDASKRENWQTWFFDDAYTVSELPSYEIESASNPFKTFAQLPAGARYRFMLNEANFTVKGFIKGPVCKGPSAVNVINEHFWVFFMDPDNQDGAAMEQVLANTKALLDMPAKKEDTLNLLGAWDEFADKERAFLRERSKFIQQQLQRNGVFDLNLIWDGDGTNPNAALTVYRHYDNASVHQGLNGQPPKTAWVIDYPLLERIHYLLVAGYDVYGNISHQLLSRIYMDFLRMEGESLFLTFFSQSDREAIRQHWYRKADKRIEKFMSITDLESQTNSIVADAEGSPKLALYDRFAEHIGSAMHDKYRLESINDDDIRAAINDLQSVASKGLMHLPEVSFVQVVDEQDTQYFTLTRNIGHLNNTSILFEKLFVAEKETSTSLVPGFIGPRPNAFMRVPRAQFSAFTKRVASLSNKASYKELMDDYGIRRTNPEFWQHYNAFLDGFKARSPIDYGVLDLNNLENR